MAKKRGPDGMPMDVPTVPAKKKGEAGQQPAPSRSLFGGDVPTAPPPGKGANPPPAAPPAAGAGSSLFPDDVPTVPAGAAGQAAVGGVSAEVDDGDPKTVIHGGRRKPKGGNEQDAQAAEADSMDDAMDDPLAGWLVVINGPGKGHSLKVGYGQNSLGKGDDQRIRLNFGDDQISRQNHAIITYDPRGKSFYFQQGTGTNLAYLNDAPVLAPTILEDGNNISLGETTLRFVAFCNADFTWQDLED